MHGNVCGGRFSSSKSDAATLGLGGAPPGTNSNIASGAIATVNSSNPPATYTNKAGVPQGSGRT